MEVSLRCWCTCAAICSTLFVLSGYVQSVSVEKSDKLASLDAISYYFNIEITNRVYNDSLRNPDSPDYKQMRNEVSSALYSVYGCSSCNTAQYYQGVKGMTFRNGSVIAQSVIKFTGVLTNTFVIKFLFLNALSTSNNTINDLQIYPNFTNDAYVTTTIPPKTTTRTTTTPTTTTTTTTTTPTTTPSTTPTTTPTTTPSTTPTTTPTTTPSTTPTTTPTSTTTTPTTTPTSTTTTLQTTRATIEQSSRSLNPTKHTKHTDTTSTTTKNSTKSSSSPLSSHSASNPATHNRVTNSSFTKNKDSSPSSNPYEGVPGWAIALLVLAAIAILLLLIIIIILLVRWCCVDNGDDVRSLPPQEHTPYMRTTFREPLSVPAYSPHTPQKNLYPFDDLPQSPKPKPSRTGTYVVNPER